MQCDGFAVFNDNRRQADASMLFVGAVEENAFTQRALRRVTQWPWIEHPKIGRRTLYH